MKPGVPKWPVPLDKPVSGGSQDAGAPPPPRPAKSASVRTKAGPASSGGELPQWIYRSMSREDAEGAEAVFVRGAVLKRAFVWRTVWLACARTPRQEQ